MMRVEIYNIVAFTVENLIMRDFFIIFFFIWCDFSLPTREPYRRMGFLFFSSSLVVIAVVVVVFLLMIWVGVVTVLTTRPVFIVWCNTRRYTNRTCSSTTYLFYIALITILARLLYLNFVNNLRLIRLLKFDIISIAQWLTTLFTIIRFHLLQLLLEIIRSY